MHSVANYNEMTKWGMFTRITIIVKMIKALQCFIIKAILCTLYELILKTTLLLFLSSLFYDQNY